jgi:hypothetical protein
VDGSESASEAGQDELANTAGSSEAPPVERIEDEQRPIEALSEPNRSEPIGDHDSARPELSPSTSKS